MSDRAYLDIETSFTGKITVVGIYLPDLEIIQLIGDEITHTSLMDALSSAGTIVTYNGNRFDFPVIKRRVGLDLRSHFLSCDLMYDCWRQGFYGGLKGVEHQLGISRRTKGITGGDAPVLWERYVRKGDREALELLLRYNRDDVMNLVVLEQLLSGCAERSSQMWYSGEV
jgi:uncharacterized protein YprB with RNaseH-like and TPR domain